MKNQTSVALAAALLLAGVTAASAAGLPSSAETKMARPASDTLSLTSAQQKTAWKDLYMKSLTQEVPAGFAAKVGAVVPKSITTAPVTPKASGDVPALRSYAFAMIKGKVLIVNPNDHKIAEVITG
jgi:hypothetical protein